jgi:hypothetical protein
MKMMIVVAHAHDQFLDGGALLGGQARQWFVQQQREQQGKFGFVQGIVDLAGNPRFVRLKKV